jgi:hypothetical protein
MLYVKYFLFLDAGTLQNTVARSFCIFAEIFIAIDESNEYLNINIKADQVWYFLN